MKNRKQRYQQRVYKFEDQQRVPEYFQDIYDPKYLKEIYADDRLFWDKSIYDPVILNEIPFCARDNYHYRRIKTCGDLYCDRCARYRNMEDWVSVDSNPCGFVHKRKHATDAAVVGKHSANRYAVLGNEEETSSDIVVGEKERTEICLNREDILDDERQKWVEDESDWKVYQSKYTRKCCKVIERDLRVTAAYKQRLGDTQKWIDSWHNDDEVTIIHTDGFFRRNRKAGYGVIIRNRFGVPIVASAGVHNQGKPVSALYHELQGINRGLELAIKYGLCNYVIVYCSSYLAADLVGSWFECFGWDHDSTLDNVCSACVKSHDPDCSEKDFQLLMYPLIQEIVRNSSMLYFDIYEVTRRQNKVADYLAKLCLEKEEIYPLDFPEELKDMLYEDAQGGDLMPRIQRERPDWFETKQATWDAY